MQRRLSIQLSPDLLDFSDNLAVAWYCLSNVRAAHQAFSCATPSARPDFSAVAAIELPFIPR